MLLSAWWLKLLWIFILRWFPLFGNSFYPELNLCFLFFDKKNCSGVTVVFEFARPRDFSYLSKYFVLYKCRESCIKIESFDALIPKNVHKWKFISVTHTKTHIARELGDNDLFLLWFYLFRYNASTLHYQGIFITKLLKRSYLFAWSFGL